MKAKMRAKIIDRGQLYSYHLAAAEVLGLTRFEKGRYLPEDWRYLEVEILSEIRHENGTSTLVGIEFPDGSQYVIGKSGLEILEDPPLFTREHWRRLLPVIQAFAEGREIYSQGYPLKIPAFDSPVSCYSIVPPTRIVNGFEVPVPESEALPSGRQYWTANPGYSSFCQEFIWRSGANDSRNLERGLVHLSEAAAIANAKAMIGIDPNE
jgi:hypothetical protein